MKKRHLRLTSLLGGGLLLAAGLFTGCEFLQENLNAELTAVQDEEIGTGAFGVTEIHYLGANDTAGTVTVDYTKNIGLEKDMNGDDKALSGTIECAYTAASPATNDDGARTVALGLPSAITGDDSLVVDLSGALSILEDADGNTAEVTVTDLAGLVNNVTGSSVLGRKVPAISETISLLPLFDELSYSYSDTSITTLSFALAGDPSEMLVATTGLTVTGADSYAFREDSGSHYVDFTISTPYADGTTSTISLGGLKDVNRDSMTAVTADFTVVANLAANNYPACAIQGNLVDPGWASARVMADLGYGLWGVAVNVATAGDYQFKFDVTADQTWGTGGTDNFGYGQITDTGSTLTVSDAGGNFEATFEVGTYFFLVNERDSSASSTGDLSFTVTKAGTDVSGATYSTMVIKGDMNGWSTTAPWEMTYLGAETWLYYNDYATAATQNFKFDDSADWAGDDFGSAATGLNDNSGNNSIAFTVDEYLFSFNEETPSRTKVETL